MHSRSNLFCPIDKSYWWNFFTILEQIIQWTIWAVFHDDAVAWGLCAHTPGIDNTAIICDSSPLYKYYCCKDMFVTVSWPHDFMNRYFIFHTFVFIKTHNFYKMHLHHCWFINEMKLLHLRLDFMLVRLFLILLHMHTVLLNITGWMLLIFKEIFKFFYSIQDEYQMFCYLTHLKKIIIINVHQTPVFI